MSVVDVIYAKELRPLERFQWRRWEWECERQARRTTFARAIPGSELFPARIQIKRTEVVYRAVIEGRA